MMGNDIAAALVILQNMGIDAFGLNCSTGDQMLPHIQRLQKYAEVPLIAKPNAGMPKTKNGVTYYDGGPDELASYVKELAAAGVGIFGSCCGSTEEHIRAIHRELRDVEFLPPHPDFRAKSLWRRRRISTSCRRILKSAKSILAMSTWRIPARRQRRTTASS